MFQLPNKVKQEIANYKSALNSVEQGRLAPARFKGIRVPWGIYAQRGAKAYMVRIRVPAACLTPRQLKALARASVRYGNGQLHMTTREDIQIHNVQLKDTIKIMEFLKEYNLSPRGGGGNTVRNIIACPLSGVCPTEVFAVRSHALALTEYLLRQDSSFNLPRKFKIAFCGCGRDCVGCLINDLGFVAKIKDGNKGFQVFVGGGLGANSRVGKLLEEFIPESELGYCVQAVKDVFYQRGDRRNKHHNRLRFLIEDIGLKEFKQLYRSTYQGLKAKEQIVLRKIDFTEKAGRAQAAPEVQDEAYNQFLQYNVRAQKQSGFVSVELRIPRGDITADALAALADLEQDFKQIEFRTSQRQNLLILWVGNAELYRLFSKLKKILKDFLYPQTLLDVVACKGALTCNLGLCNSPALAQEIEELVRNNFLGAKVLRTMEIKLNGCPNACGQQPLGLLSFYGMVKRVDNRPLPFYKFLLGGKKQGAKTSLAEEAGVLPAKNIPRFLQEFLRQAEKTIDKAEEVEWFSQGSGRKIAAGLLAEYSFVPAFEENKDPYIDWGRKTEFSLAGLGPGECGAGVLDMIEADLTAARLALAEAEKNVAAVENIKQALLFCARALLVVKGQDPQSEKAVLDSFQENFVDTGIVPKIYANLRQVLGQLARGLDKAEREQKLTYAREFLREINGLYKSMDSAFNFPKKAEEEKKAPVPRGPAHFMDLKGTPCPINYVKVKLKLEDLKPAEVLEVLLDEGEPMENVPQSLKADGHRILKMEKQDGFYKVTIKKKY